jgi:hypothetical protein
MRLILLDARLDLVRAADALQAVRDVVVVPPGIVAAITANDLERAGVVDCRVLLLS